MNQNATRLLNIEHAESKLRSNQQPTDVKCAAHSWPESRIFIQQAQCMIQRLPQDLDGEIVISHLLVKL